MRVTSDHGEWLPSWQMSPTSPCSGGVRFGLAVSRKLSIIGSVAVSAVSCDAVASAASRNAPPASTGGTFTTMNG